MPSFHLSMIVCTNIHCTYIIMRKHLTAKYWQVKKKNTGYDWGQNFTLFVHFTQNKM